MEPRAPEKIPVQKTIKTIKLKKTAFPSLHKFTRTQRPQTRRTTPLRVNGPAVSTSFAHTRTPSPHRSQVSTQTTRCAKRWRSSRRPYPMTLFPSVGTIKTKSSHSTTPSAVVTETRITASSRQRSSSRSSSSRARPSSRTTTTSFCAKLSTSRTNTI